MQSASQKQENKAIQLTSEIEALTSQMETINEELQGKEAALGQAAREQEDKQKEVLSRLQDQTAVLEQLQVRSPWCGVVCYRAPILPDTHGMTTWWQIDTHYCANNQQQSRCDVERATILASHMRCFHCCGVEHVFLPQPILLAHSHNVSWCTT
jgi:Tfp pilus assembly protein PilN